MKALVIGYGSIGKRHVKNLQKISKVEIIVYTNQKNIKKNTKIKFIHSIKDGIAEKPNFAIISNVTSSHLKTSINLSKN
jgi:lactate dehydrogenase-like 2-hydroxyacid dehydrogenase